MYLSLSSPFSVYKKLNIIILILCVMLYIINRYTKFYETDEGIIKYIWDYHFTDFLCQITYFSVCNIFLHSIKRDGIYHLKAIAIFSIVCCIMWEIGILLLKPDATFDYYDCLAYAAGAAVYYMVFKIYRRRRIRQKR